MRSTLFINKTYSRQQLRGLFEAILFVNGKSVSFEKLVEAMDMSRKEIAKLANEINEEYNQSQRGLNIIRVAGGYQLVSNPIYVDELTELFGRRNENQLSKSALETLAVIAYKQPASKEKIDDIRGVSSTRSINLLLGMKLIAITGASEDMVKSPLYSTTSRFLEMFRIQSLEDLPSIENLNLDDFSEEDDDEAESQEETNTEKNEKKSALWEQDHG